MLKLGTQLFWSVLKHQSLVLNPGLGCREMLGSAEV